ncbi:hypothetical protein TraAM80_00930 [Trypanosoma rangeli]|uniref:FPL domain-containing protein n=1 Tax=Trypanosoma rangeli TaxID=5698 RepID=A0A3R7M9K7_TRYRA|nr:uncharacterized protein TraAM80_00930 [Trypanosoma rangeli]RNF11484.1 hypothetical protein TraAM80_00930 [Trypanosoma rangeli]|eukprot:RNF11484.1 hypothetical protein TraAM80_00930 [Trypanosoma rangeli]
MKRLSGSRHNKFSQANVDYLCQEVQRMEDSQMFYLHAFVEALRELAEVLIWSDKNAESVFDSFLERRMMGTFERIVTNAEFPSAVKVQVIQCITMMLQNLTRKSSMYFICSNNHLNRIISIFIDETDDELLSTYVSFLKSLALRLNGDTVQFFFERETRSFPLFDRASKLLAAPDRMVRAAARQVVISVAQLHEQAITIFLEDALREVFKVISTLLWLQIQNLAEAVAEYGNVERTSERSLHPIGISTLSDRLEDIVDDLFYINDLFVVPHTFVPPCLEHVLDEVVLTPLVMLLENPPCSVCCFAKRPSFCTCVSASVSLSVLTRWIPLNKAERLQRLFKVRLINFADPRGAVLGRLLKSKCADVLSGAVMLLNAVVLAGLIEKGTRDEEDGMTADGNEETSRDASEERGVPAVTDMLNGNWSIRQPHSEPPPSFPPPLQPRSMVSCEVFVRCMCQRVRQGGIRRWCEGLISALYHLITSPACTRLSVFDVGLRVLMDFAHDKRESYFLFRGLLLLCHSVVVRRAAACAESLALQKNDGVTPALKSAALCNTTTMTSPNATDAETTTSNDEKSSGRWLRSPHELLFVKLEHVAREFNPFGEKSRVSLSKEASLLLPLLPSLEFIKSERVKENDSNQVTRWEFELNHAQEYVAMQRSVAALVPPRLRAAFDHLEEEDNEFWMWLTVRHHTHQMMGKEDGFLRALRKYGVRHHTGETVRLPQRDRVYFRCEFVKGRFLLGASSPKVATGTPMYMLLRGTEVIFLDAGDTVRRTDRGVKFRVMFALQLIYVQALVSQPPFSAIVTHVHPASPLELHVVFRHRGEAASAVGMVTERSSLCRSSGAALVYRALHHDGYLHVANAKASEAEMHSSKNVCQS